MTCAHKNLKHGYEKTYDVTWCLDCGTITHASDGLIGPGLHKRQDFSNWINANLAAWSCRNEAHDGKRCAQWCGGASCPAAIRKATSEVQPQILTDDSLKRLGARLAKLLDDDQWNNIEPLLVTIKDEQAAELANVKAERDTINGGLQNLAVRYEELAVERNELKSFISALQGLHAGDIETLKAERDAAVADAERYRWLKECTNEQFEHLSGQWCALDLTIDVMMKIEHNGGYASTSAMKCQHVFDHDRCVICGSVA